MKVLIFKIPYLDFCRPDCTPQHLDSVDKKATLVGTSHLGPLCIE